MTCYGKAASGSGHQSTMAFEEVKARLVADPVLACPDFSRPRTPKRSKK